LDFAHSLGLVTLLLAGRVALGLIKLVPGLAEAPGPVLALGAGQVAGGLGKLRLEGQRGLVAGELEVWAVDMPGFGAAPAAARPVSSSATLTD